MKVEKTELPGVLLITPPTIFRDHRGDYVETYNRRLYEEIGITVDFVQDDASLSRFRVLRGLHGDDHTWKLIDCLCGHIYLVVVDWRVRSPHYRQWLSFYLDDRGHQQVLIPPGFLNGHQVLSSQAVFHYKQSAYYDPDSQWSVAWNSLGIQWPYKDPILSKRDSHGGVH